MAHPHVPADLQSAGAGRRLRHRATWSHRDQGQGQNAHLLAARQEGLRQGAADAPANRVSFSSVRKCVGLGVGSTILVFPLQKKICFLCLRIGKPIRFVCTRVFFYY